MFPSPQEEYRDKGTLEARLQAVARIMVARPNQQGGSGGASASLGMNAVSGGLGASGGSGGLQSMMPGTTVIPASQGPNAGMQVSSKGIYYASPAL